MEDELGGVDVLDYCEAWPPFYILSEQLFGGLCWTTVTLLDINVFACCVSGLLLLGSTRYRSCEGLVCLKKEV